MRFLDRNGRSLTSRTCNKTCLNGGQCYTDDLHGGQARCSCSNDYYGERCEYGNFVVFAFEFEIFFVV
jgi:hypothetical protein